MFYLQSWILKQLYSILRFLLHRHEEDPAFHIQYTFNNHTIYMVVERKALTDHCFRHIKITFLQCRGYFHDTKFVEFVSLTYFNQNSYKVRYLLDGKCLSWKSTSFYHGSCQTIEGTYLNTFTIMWHASFFQIFSFELDLRRGHVRDR